MKFEFDGYEMVSLRKIRREPAATIADIGIRPGDHMEAQTFYRALNPILRVVRYPDGQREVQFRNPGGAWQTAPEVGAWEALAADVAEGLVSLDSFTLMSQRDKDHVAAMAEEMKKPRAG